MPGVYMFKIYYDTQTKNFLKVVLDDGQSTEYGQKIADDLMDKLGIMKEDLLSGAYMDLILAKQSS